MRKYLALLAVAGLSLLPVVPAAAATSHAQARSTITPGASAAAAAWLAAQVKPDGFLALPATPTTANLGLTAQGLLSLAAAGVAKPKVDAMESYLAAHVDDYVVSGGADQPGPLAYLILDALATGSDATNFGGANLVTRLEATQQPSGLFGSQDATYDGAFRQGLSLLALHGVGVDSSSGATWLSDQQCADGGWTAYRADTSVPCPAADPVTFAGPDTNSSALAAEALHALGVTPAHDPVAWFTSVRSSGGGFAYLGDPTQAADANSTGLVTQALLALTGSPDTAGVSALEAFQAGCTADVADRGGLAFQPAVHRRPGARRGGHGAGPLGPLGPGVPAHRADHRGHHPGGLRDPHHVLLHQHHHARHRGHLHHGRGGPGGRRQRPRRGDRGRAAPHGCLDRAPPGRGAPADRRRVRARDRCPPPSERPELR